MTSSENSKSGAVIAAVITGVFLVVVAIINGAFQIITTYIENKPIVITPTAMFIESVQPTQESQIANTPALSPTLSAERIFVSATSAPSYIYTPTITGNYIFQYESGAYSTQPTDDSILPQFSWHTAVRFFREIKNWRDDQTSMGIANPDWAIDPGTPFRYRESEALSDAQNAMNTGKMSVVIHLEQNVPIYLQIADTSPEDNRGGVWLSVILQK